MKYIFKFLFLVYLILVFVINDVVSYEKIALLVLIVGLNVFMERFGSNIYIVLISFALICIGAWLDKSFGVLFCLTVYDLIYKKAYYALLPVIAGVMYFLHTKDSILMIMLICICSVLSYVTRKKDDKELIYKNSIDDERRLRYELEATKNKLLNSTREVAYLAETRERNRIAREIHDNVGHSIAGILIQLQAAHKLYRKDNEKSQEILKKSIDGLADTVTLLRDTVHNIRPSEIVGVDYIKTIISNFNFCPVQFGFTGNFDMLPTNHMEIIGTSIKEALTNASKHSRATKIEISIDINDGYTRLYIKDNGIGCKSIKEGMGLSGIRERVSNTGGTVSISAEDGFLIVCVIPRFNSEGGGIFESINS